MTGYKGYVTKANDHDQKANGFKELKNMRSKSATAGQTSNREMNALRNTRKKSSTGSGALSDKEYNMYRNKK